MSLIVLVVLFAVLVAAGGSTMAAVPGQVVVRCACIIALIAAFLVGTAPGVLGRALRTEFAVVALVIALVIVMVVAQLVPLPPALWLALPGRALLAEAALASGQPQPWRPLAIVPGGALNAAAALIVPVTVLVLVCGLKRSERSLLPGLVLATTVASLMVGLLQFTGVDLTNPLINASPGVDGLFANRNHFALFMAVGCVAAPAWAAANGHGQSLRWRGPTALALTLLFMLALLASGSRSGIVLGALGVAGGAALGWRAFARRSRGQARLPARRVIAGVLAAIVVIVAISIIAGRAISIDRLLALDTAQDLRTQNLPVVLAMVRDYFPAGSGFGGFDPVFRIHEPTSALRSTYYNHAHNDLLEIVLEGGIGGLALLVGGLSWSLWAGVRAWRLSSHVVDAAVIDAARMGSMILLLVTVASLVDYPARTPIIMAVLVIAGACLCAGRPSVALPISAPRL